MNNYLTVDSFGSEAPQNWEDIAAFLNNIIDERGIADDHDACNELWEEYWNGGIPSAPSPVKLWYAVQMDRDDDWGTGSYNRDEAIQMARKMRETYPDALIAVIDEHTTNPVCVDEITEF